ncbi:zona pellucida-binding protein 2 isoform X4 [Otolemur garnettii]|uniref:zona pellucida-binding protein 2 isoform X4 n=1 Tax=Otolemur garnettii TaxID=30611 RepID=UPI000C7EB88D|nr:zona pellucida-binding protein 2 isoform X4 [Otolemur garnettii]
MRAWVLFSAVLWYLAGVGWQRSSLFSKKGYVYGQPGHPVKIYVKLHQNSPVLICMDYKYAKKEIVDPTYIWIGPNEKTLTGNNRINITKVGELLVKDFLEPLSGLYTCTFSYKTVKAETQEEKTIQKRYDFLLFEPSYKCHSVEIPERGLIHELFIAFQVNPFAPGWRSLCNKSDDCEDITNHNVLQWFVVLGLLVLMSMLFVSPAFLSISMELNRAHKLQTKISNMKTREIKP